MMRPRSPGSVLGLAVCVGAAVLAACASPRRYSSFDDVRYGYARERSFWSARAGLRLRVAELGASGAAPSDPAPVVLLHPWGFNMAVWADVAPQLAETRRVLLVDLPGHGKSDKALMAMPMDRIAWAVIDAMDEAGLSKAVLAGNSLGGATALAVAEADPSRVEALVLIAAPGGGALATPLRRLAEALGKPSELRSASAEVWWVGLTLAGGTDSPLARRLRDDVIALTEADEYPAWCRSSLASLRSVIAYTPPLERVAVPALVIHGEDDLLIDRDLSESMARRLPVAELVVLEDCGHLPEVECPERLLEAMADFLRGRVQGR